jgi:hypothetical protein
VIGHVLLQAAFLQAHGERNLPPAVSLHTFGVFKTESRAGGACPSRSTQIR